MEAVQLTSFEGISSLKLVEIPKPSLGPDEVLIQVKAAGINYAEAEQIRGKYPTFGKELPFTLGFEAAGIVVALGAEVTGTQVASPSGYLPRESLPWQVP